MGILDNLATQLERALRVDIASSVFGEPQSTAVACRQVIESQSGRIGPLPERATLSALLKFRNSRKAESLRELRHVCAGVGLRAADGWQLLGDGDLLTALLSIVEGYTGRARLRCIQAFLWAYFSFLKFDERTSVSSKQGWERLRSWLREYIDAGAVVSPEPRWFSAIRRHSNLLELKPCARYGAALASGDRSELEDAIQSLSIAPESWVYLESLLAHCEAIAAKPDVEFRSAIPSALEILIGGQHSVPPPLRALGVGKLVQRYSRSSTKPEHPQLRDAAIAEIGNPWLNRPAWDSTVLLPSGDPDDAARDMVNSWLKRRLISDFFELLSDDHGADGRRLRYWLRYESEMEDLWIALGPRVFTSRRREYVELRRRADGRLLQLVNGGDVNNNAFIMRFGRFLIVEFGVTGNACFAFRSDAAPVDLVPDAVVSGNSTGLKHREHLNRLLHIDSTYESWETKFDEWLMPRIGKPDARVPQARQSSHNSDEPELSAAYKINWGALGAAAFAPKEESRGAFVPAPPGVADSSDEPPSVVDAILAKHRALDAFLESVRREGIKCEDNRPRGGALWVYINNPDLQRVTLLKGLGFRYRDGRGWWRE